MPDLIITYENLYEILRKEKYRPELQKVEETFYSDVVKYLKEKTAILESQSKKESIFASESEKTQTQLKNVQKILKELYEKRENKIIQVAIFGSRTPDPPDRAHMLPIELVFYKDIKTLLDKYREGVLLRILQNNAPELSNLPELKEQKDLKIEEKTNTLNILTTVEIPEFVGPDLEVYGPYKTNESLALPEKIANLLIQTNQAKNENT